MPAVWGTATHVKITSGQTVSGEVDLRGLILIGVQFPAAFTGVTLAFQSAEVPTKEGGVYAPVSLSTGAGAAVAVSLTAAPATTVFCNFQPMGNCMMKVVSGAAEAADRDIIIYVSPL
jgi:hypothetical protein